MNKLPVSLIARADHEEPLTPTCVVGVGAVAAALCARLLAETAAPDGDDPLAHLDGLRTLDPPLVLIRGAAARLPWVEGALYLGELAPGLHAPTTSTLNVPAALVRDALAKHVPLALIPVRMSAGAPRTLRVSLRALLPVARELLAVVARARPT